MLIPPEHDFLVRRAARWAAAQGYPIVVSELSLGYGEEADVLAFKTHQSLLIECKASRSDFLSDRRKPFRREPAMGMGHKRMYFAPEGLIAHDELPERWGLVEYLPDGKLRVMGGTYFRERDIQKECDVLMSVLRRVGNGMDRSVSIRAYTYETKNKAELLLELEPEMAEADGM